MKNNLPPLIEIYRALITMPLISATEEALNQSDAGLITLLVNWFKDLGFNVEVQPVLDMRNKFNTLVNVGQGAGGLLLVGHIDIISFDDGRWTCDPFILTEYDDKLYGLGMTDAEGSFVFTLDVPCDVDVTELKKLLYILTTADEETNMAGARYFSEATALHPDCAIIGESTSLQPVRAHKGHISNATYVLEQSGHSSDPARGVDATELMHDVVGHIMHLCNDLKVRYHHDTPTVPYSTLNLSHIHSGDAANRICVCCELHMDVRLLPGIMLNDLNGLFDEALTSVNEHQSGCLAVSKLHPPIPGYEYPPGHQPVEVVEKLLGARTRVVNHCTEAPFTQTLYPTLALSPGSIDQTYQPDEYLETRFIKPIRELITQVVRHFC